MNQVLDAIRTVVGPRGWIDEASDMESYGGEERGLYRGSCLAVVRPADTAEVAQVLRLCDEAGLAVYPQGGNTGLVGGAVPQGGIVLSTERLSRLRAVDALNHTLTVESGMILADVQRAAEEAGAYFPLSLGAEGSCRIGGNLSTNAGGINVLRYGNARDLVLGLEVVLADGRIWDGLRGLRKDNSGYDLKHLFVGAEGTLGVITAATLKLFPHPVQRETAMAALGSVEAVLDLFKEARDALGGLLTAFELIPRRGLEFAQFHIPGVADPFPTHYPWYVLFEAASPRPGDDLRGTLETILEAAFETGTVADAVLADSLGRRQALWRIRETIPEAQKPEGGSIKHDVAVPISRVAEFMHRATAAVEAAIPGVRVCPFGHVGDGNIHFNLSQPVGADTDAFLARWHEMNRIVHDIAVSLDGTFSAEHGIGLLKKDDLAHYRSPVELELMRSLKRTLDPRNIMNPGKLLDV
ncbi:MAG: FAD-binding oxidoreductase [Magnetospirillum sp. WYHS-4]